MALFFYKGKKRSKMKNLEGKKIAILTTNGFEEVELTNPKKVLEEAGATVDIVSPEAKTVKGWNHDHWSIEVPVNKQINQVSVEDYDALMLPGGVLNGDKLRVHSECVNLAKQFMESGKPVAAICHGPQLLIETGLVHGMVMTSAKNIKTDLENAGAIWEDQPVVTDNGLVTSRGPKDLPQFNKKFAEEIKEGKHVPQQA